MGLEPRHFQEKLNWLKKRVMPSAGDYSITFLCLTILNASKRPINAPANRNTKVKDIGVEFCLKITWISINIPRSKNPTANNSTVPRTVIALRTFFSIFSPSLN